MSLPKAKSQGTISSKSSSRESLVDQKSLEDSLHSIKVNAFHMRKCLDQEKVQDALKYAGLLAQELSCTSNALEPKQYYELYMSVFDQLRVLSDFLRDKYMNKEKLIEAVENIQIKDNSQSPRSDGGRTPEGDTLNVMRVHDSKLAELYEIVQYQTNIVSRMYLMITVGSIYIQQKHSPKKEVLLDMLDMCKGVQHPMRGLFLRYYLQQSTKELLDKVEKDDAYYFILANFGEMNKLWVRLQYQGHSRDRVKREQERKELKILVGTNLVRLSQLEIPSETYKLMLPKILEQIVSCKDVLAQEYLMEAIIQVFPDEFHLLTLDLLLEAIKQLHPNVNVKLIVISLIDRFSASDEVKIDLFEVFYGQISQIIKERDEFKLSSVLELLISLSNMSIKLYGEKLQNLVKVTKSLSELIKIKFGGPGVLEDGELLVTFVKILLESYDSVLVVLQEQDFANALDELIRVVNNHAILHEIALAVTNALLDKATKVGELAQVSLVFKWIEPLLKDCGDGTKDDHDFIHEQCLVGKLIHLMSNEQNEDEQMLILTAVRQAVAHGGIRRIGYTVPSLISESIKLQERFIVSRRSLIDEEKQEEHVKKSNALFKFMHQCIQLLTSNLNELQLKLFLMPLYSSHILESNELIAYEFIVQAFTIYEDSVSDTKQQIHLLQLMIASLYNSAKIFSAENYDTLATKCALYAARMLKKEDQCRLVLKCSHLFQQTEGRRVLECLQKCLKIADSCMDPIESSALFIDILNEYVYHYQTGNTSITPKYINGLIDLIFSTIQQQQQQPVPQVQGEDLEARDGKRIVKYFYDTLEHLMEMKRKLNWEEISILEESNILPSLRQWLQ